MIYAYMEDVESQDTNDRKGQENYKIKFIDNIDQKDKSQINQDFEQILNFLISNIWSSTNEASLSIWNRIVLIYIGLLLLGFIIGCIFTYFILKKQIYYILDREKERYLSELHASEKYFPKWLGIIEILKRSKDQYKKEMQMVNNQSQLTIDNLKKKLIELVQENETIKAKLNTDKEETLKSHTDDFITPTTSSKFKTVFFSLPDDGGRFKVENGKKHNDGNNFYKIEHEENNSYGILHFISSELDLRAIERIQGYLLPVCEIVNFSDRIRASKINVLTPGKVIIKNDHWVVDPNNKVKIKLI